jgi:hypothetical protein
MVTEETYIVKSKVKELVKQNDKRSSDSFLEELNEVVVREVKKALIRMESNGRKTLTNNDL